MRNHGRAFLREEESWAAGGGAGSPPARAWLGERAATQPPSQLQEGCGGELPAYHVPAGAAMSSSAMSSSALRPLGLLAPAVLLSNLWLHNKQGAPKQTSSENVKAVAVLAIKGSAHFFFLLWCSLFPHPASHSL